MRRSQLVEAWVDSEEIGSAVWQGGSTPPSLPMTEKYNGYTNYATWRVNLEIVEQIDIEFAVEENLRFDADMVKEWVEFAVFDDEEPDNLMSWYADAFLSEVNYTELAMQLNEEIEERIKYNTTSDR